MTTKLAKHTPGPWEVHVHSSGELRIGNAEPQVTIASMGLWLPDEMSEQRANGSLIAAAPAMLEALIELNTELNLDALANHFPVAEAVVGKIKAAIRAAVGEQEENTQ